MDKSELVQQTENAFDFIQKLYLEVSYLIKEIEGQLAEEPEKFVIGRPSGYSITARSSTGLEPFNVGFWPLRKFNVFFVPEEKTEINRGNSITKFESNLAIIYLRIILDDKNIQEPVIHIGILHSFEKKTEGGKWPEKIEHLMGATEYNESTIFTDNLHIDYENGYYKMKGTLFRVNLFDINSSDDIHTKLVEPTLKLYRSIV